MAKKNTTVKRNSRKQSIAKKQRTETDSTYFLKIVVFLILGSQWVYIWGGDSWQIPIPVGLIIGLVFATHEHFQIDRKIEYVVLLFATFISFWLPVGLVIQL